MLVALNVLVYLAMAISGVSLMDPTPQDLLKWGAGYGPYELGTQWWRLFTAMFVHIGLIHILVNMLCLMSIGPLAEAILGSRRFLSLYVLSGVGGSIASVALHPSIVAAGASGAIFGVAGALLPVLHMRNIPAIVSFRGRGGKVGVGGFIVYNLVYGFLQSGIDNAAHVGGLLIGFVIGYTLPLAGSHSSRAAAWRTRVVLLGVTVLLGSAFVAARRVRGLYAGSGFNPPVRTEDYLGIDRPRVQPVEQRRPEEVVREIQNSLRGHPDDAASLAALGSALYELKAWPQAVDAFTRFARIDSTNPSAWANLGDAYLQWGRAVDAVPPLVRATVLARQDESFRYLLGTAYMESKQYALAAATFDTVLKLAPGNPLALEKRRQALRFLTETRPQ